MKTWGILKSEGFAKHATSVLVQLIDNPDVDWILVVRTKDGERGTGLSSSMTQAQCLEILEDAVKTFRMAITESN